MTRTFQSTHSKECDDFFTSNPTNQIVSIHAPLRVRLWAGIIAWLLY